ncbi:hypothetical protein ACVWY2_007026 [Bradyrhizobium sp. JR6.1]
MAIALGLPVGQSVALTLAHRAGDRHCVLHSHLRPHQQPELDHAEQEREEERRDQAEFECRRPAPVAPECAFHCSLAVDWVLMT